MSLLSTEFVESRMSAVLRLSKSLGAWGAPDFEHVLKQEIEALDGSLLPLQQGLSQGSHVVEKAWSMMIISIADAPEMISIRAGIFYASLLAGCSCADDPTPVDELAEYCELQFDIDKSTADTRVMLLT